MVAKKVSSMIIYLKLNFIIRFKFTKREISSITFMLPNTKLKDATQRGTKPGLSLKAAPLRVSTQVPRGARYDQNR